MPLLPRRALLLGAVVAPLAAPMVPMAPYAWGTEAPSGGLVTSVKDYGALGDGKTNDTNAIRRAFDAAGPGGTVFFPPGSYIYAGPGLDFENTPDIRVIGASNNSSTINLDNSSYFIDHGYVLRSLLLRDLTFTGGKGAVRHRFRGPNVQQKYLVTNCRFKGYSECAIATEASDMPYWIIRDCIFDSANTTDTIGVALGGLTDQCILDACSFIRNRIHVKARGGGNNLHVTRCDFLQFSQENTKGPRVSVWIVPATTWINSGQGLTITGCKFGNENLSPGDYRILYADEGPGETNGAQFPNLQAESAAYISGHNITQNLFAGQSSGSHPIIFSTTANVRDIQLHHNGIAGGPPSYAIEFENPSGAPNALTDTNLFGPFSGSLSGQYPPFAASNAEGVGYWVDPQANSQMAKTIRTWPSGTSASFRNVLLTRIGEFDVASAQKTGATDAYGLSEAVTVTFSKPSGTISTILTAATPLTVGMPLWVEFDISHPEALIKTRSIIAEIRDDAGGIHWRRCIEVPSADQGWIGFSFCFTPRTSGTAPRTRLSFRPASDEAEQTCFKLGRIRVYHSNERQFGGLRPTVGPVAANHDQSMELVNDIRNNLVRLGLFEGTAIPLGSGEINLADIPAHSTSAGRVGQMAWDSNYFYICTASDNWKRVPLEHSSW